MDHFDLKKDFSEFKATYVITIVTILVWIGQLLAFGNQATTGINLLNSGALWGPNILADPTQLWRLVTPIFLHIGWTHLLFNMFTLFFIGRQVEAVFGWKSFTLIYFISGIFGNAMSFLFSPQSLSAGASGAIFGLFGAVVGLGYFTEMPVLKQIGKTFAVLIVINLLLNVFNIGAIGSLGSTQVNIWAHIGGAIGGLLLSAIFPPKSLKRAIPAHYKIITSIVFAGLLLAFIILPFMTN
ncbi:rhomboid family intramembrane serine protease [Lactococcus sp.]|uniref:rhomboid family intramembrane serine protease n=1 Tax=Lactococcus sp. TaxID=44273 RepID=UPI0035B29B83